MPPRKTRAAKAAAAAAKAPPPPPPPATSSTEPSTSPEVEATPALSHTEDEHEHDHEHDEEEEDEVPRRMKSTAPSPSPALEARGASRSKSRSRSRKTGTGDSDDGPSGTGGAGVTVMDEVAEDEDDEVPPSCSAVPVDAEGEEHAAQDEQEEEDEEEDGAAPTASEKGKAPEVATRMSMEDRLAKLKDLRIRMSQSSAANRKDLVTDHQKSRVTAKELARLEKQKKLAQTLRLKAEAEETGEDMERKKNWEWSIEQNERWEAKLDDQKVRGDTHFHNAEDDAHKLYNRNIRSTKADLVHYERQKEAALGLAPGTLVPAGSTSASLAASGSKARGLTAMEDLYRGADTMSYGDSKPSEEAVDRVISKINKDMDKGKRKKKDDSNDEVNYINDRNKVFNKKIARYFDKYTKEIRANFERGTAL